MLPFDFDYYRPETLQEAFELYHYLNQHGKQPFYISGGTELLTLGRIDLAFTEAVIDLKGIPECHVIQMNEDHLLLGSSVPLAAIEEENPFPLLTKTASEIADHTARVKITLGGNICARIFYREVVLPLLLADSRVMIMGAEGEKIVPINEVFQGQLRLNSGEFLVQTITERRYLQAPYFTVKRRQQWETGYPLITLAALKMEQRIRVAVSGLCPFPFRSAAVEESINAKGQSMNTRVEGALAALPQPILDDVEGSKEYRLFVLGNLLVDALETLDRESY